VKTIATQVPNSCWVTHLASPWIAGGRLSRRVRGIENTIHHSSSDLEAAKRLPVGISVMISSPCCSRTPVLAAAEHPSLLQQNTRHRSGEQEPGETPWNSARFDPPSGKLNTSSGSPRNREPLISFLARQVHAAPMGNFGSRGWLERPAHLGAAQLPAWEHEISNAPDFAF